MSAYIREIETFAKPRGWSLEKTSGGHVKLTHPNTSRHVITSSTPSDHRSFLNFKSEIRRVEREAGIIYEQEKTERATVEITKLPARPAENRTRHRRMELFPITITKNKSGEPRQTYNVRCCLCGKDYEMRSHKKEGEDLPHPSITAMLLRNKGWKIGLERSDDVCPDCAPFIASGERRAIEAKRVEDKELSRIRLPITTPPELAHIKAGHLRELATWRQIIRAIDRAYVNADVGYAAGESDEKIAKKFNVPTEAVARKRAELFGPAQPDSARRDIVRELIGLKKSLAAFQKQVIDGAAELEVRCAALLKKIEAVPAIAEEIFEGKHDGGSLNAAIAGQLAEITQQDGAKVS